MWERLWCEAHTSVCYLSLCSVASIDKEVLQRCWKQQQSLVKVELKILDKGLTGDVREARTDEQCSAEMKLYQSPCVILPAVRGYKVKEYSVAGFRAAGENYGMWQASIREKTEAQYWALGNSSGEDDYWKQSSSLQPYRNHLEINTWSKNVITKGGNQEKASFLSAFIFLHIQ